MNTVFSQDAPVKKGLRDFFHVLFRHREKAILFFTSVIIIVALVSFLSPKIYRSEAEILIKIGKESVILDPTVAPNQIVSVAAGAQRENEVNSEMEILKKSDLILRVVDTIGVEGILNGYYRDAGEVNIVRRILSFPFSLLGKATFFLSTLFESDEIKELKKKDQALRRVLSDLDVKAVKKSNSITLTYDARSPRMAQDVLSKLIEAYLDKHIQVHLTEGSYKFFVEQKDRLRDELDRTGDELKELKNNINIGDLEEQRPLILKRIGYLKREVESTEAEHAVSQAMVDSLTQGLANVPDTVMKEEISRRALSAADELRKRVHELELKENELLATFTPGSPPPEEIRRQIEEARALLAEAEKFTEVKTGINEVHQRVELNVLTEQAVLDSLEAKLTSLKAQLAEAEKELKVINDNEHRLRKLELDRMIQEESYQKYSESLEQSLIDRSLEMVKISNVRVVQSATYPIIPIRPRTALNLLLGLMFGIFGGLGLAFTSESLSHAFSAPEDIERTLEVPALGAIAAVYPDEESEKKKEAFLPIRFDSSSSVMNDFDVLAERLLAWSKMQERPPQIFSVTSCHTGEGVSTVSAYLASSLASLSGGRILLVDADIKDPSLHTIFNAQLSPGFADSAQGDNKQSALIQPSSVDNLDLLSAGLGDPSRIRKIIDQQHFSDLLEHWKSQYRYVLIDTPAVWEGNYSVCLGSVVDGVIMVFEAEAVRWEIARRAKDRLEVGGAHVMGGILNKRRFYIPNWLYRRL
jgi:capsular exopolysaccharide synthesis family protein